MQTIAESVSKLKKGFTLAEVLIVIGIIGVIAESTLPTVIQNFQVQASVAGLKKAYSTLSQAYNMAVQDNGSPDKWTWTGWRSSNDALMVYGFLSPYLRINKNCGTSTAADCFPNVIYKYEGGGSSGTNMNTVSTLGAVKFQLSDGASIMISTYGGCTSSRMQTNQVICGEFIIDVNGYKPPNQYGNDTFWFYLTTQGFVPWGTQKDYNNTYSFDNDCKNKTTAMGIGCAAWVLYNENIDYLKNNCTNLSWDGPIKCP